MVALCESKSVCGLQSNRLLAKLHGNAADGMCAEFVRPLRTGQGPVAADDDETVTTELFEILGRRLEATFIHRGIAA